MLNEQGCLMVATAQSHGRGVAERSYEKQVKPKKAATAYHIMAPMRVKHTDICLTGFDDTL